MNCRSSAIGNAAIVALLLVMTGLSCNGAPVKRSSIDRNIIVQISKYFLTEGYNALEGFNRTNASVCALFDEYSRLCVTLQYQRENDSLHTNLTLLVMIAEKLLIDTCEYTAEASSSINCSSIASISQHCLYSRSINVTKLCGKRCNFSAHPACWLTEFYRSNSLDSNSTALETLLGILRANLYSNCSLNEINNTVNCVEIV